MQLLEHFSITNLHTPIWHVWQFCYQTVSWKWLPSFSLSGSLNFFHSFEPKTGMQILNLLGNSVV